MKKILFLLISIISFSAQSQTVRIGKAEFTQTIQQAQPGDELIAIDTEGLPIKFLFPVNGGDGDSAYQIALDEGYFGSKTQWLQSLQGENGGPGEQGLTGAVGVQGETGVAGADGLVGEQGIQGVEGEKGDTGATGTAQAQIINITVSRNLSTNDIGNTIECTANATVSIPLNFTQMTIGQTVNLEAHNGAELIISAPAGVTINYVDAGSATYGARPASVLFGMLRKNGINSYIASGQ